MWTAILRRLSPPSIDRGSFRAPGLVAGVVIAYNAVTYWIAKRDAKRSPYWCSDARPIRIAANIRVAASVNNAIVLGLCP